MAVRRLRRSPVARAWPHYRRQWTLQMYFWSHPTGRSTTRALARAVGEPSNSNLWRNLQRMRQVRRFGFGCRIVHRGRGGYVEWWAYPGAAARGGVGTRRWRSSSCVRKNVPTTPYGRYISLRAYEATDFRSGRPPASAASGRPRRPRRGPPPREAWVPCSNGHQVPLERLSWRREALGWRERLPYRLPPGTARHLAPYHGDCGTCGEPIDRRVEVVQVPYSQGETFAMWKNERDQAIYRGVVADHPLPAGIDPAVAERRAALAAQLLELEPGLAPLVERYMVLPGKANAPLTAEERLGGWAQAGRVETSAAAACDISREAPRDASGGAQGDTCP